MYKKLTPFIITFILFLNLNPASASPLPENNTHEFSLSVGAGSAISILDVVQNSVRSLFSGESKINQKENFSNGLLFNLGYEYHLNQRLRIGIDLGWQSGKERYDLVRNSTNEMIASGQLSSQWLVVMPKIKYEYFQRKSFALYGKLGLGFFHYSTLEKQDIQAGIGLESRSDYKSNGSGLAFQITPIGIRAGKRLGVNAELGFGTQGIFLLGISYRI